MESGLRLFPIQASTVASRVDNLYFFMIAVSVFFTVLITVLVVLFAIRYRRRSPDEVGQPETGSYALEIVWTIVPFVLAMAMFVWGASVAFSLARVPDEALQIYAVGKQWMWKFQHPTGQREINELHVPLGQPVRVTLSSEDVIHDLYFPNFRVKADAIPGRYTELWFTATKTGRFHLFCAEYCGLKHSGMVGSVVVLEPYAYQQWLAGGATEGSLADRGRQLFTDLGCHTCHVGDTQGRGPRLAGVFGQREQLVTGETVLVNESYLRESIVNPQAKLVAGYPPIMPTFQGQVTEEQLAALVEYIKVMQDDATAAPGTAVPQAPAVAPDGAAPGTTAPTPAGRPGIGRQPTPNQD